MKSESFCYWLQGLLELDNPETLNAEQVKSIRNHLNMVFVHEIDPSLGDKEHQKRLQKIHDGEVPDKPRQPSPYSHHRGRGIGGGTRMTC